MQPDDPANTCLKGEFAIASRNEDPVAVRKYGICVEIVESALEDIKGLQRLVDDVLETGPMNVAWSVIDRNASKLDILRGGFMSVDHALNVYSSRLAGLRAALTTDTDAILTPSERESRDAIVRDYLERIRSAYVDSSKQ